MLRNPVAVEKLAFFEEAEIWVIENVQARWKNRL
jgi:hypothetical protein